MASEIEAKAWITNTEELERLTGLLEQKGCFRGEFHKRDSYYAPQRADFENGKAESDSMIRIRRTGTGNEGRAIATKKIKSFAGSVEVNRETEFTVDPAAAFTDLLTSIGYRSYIEKEKRGRSYDFSGAHAELCNVSGLGWFIEIEILIPDEEADNKREDTIEELMTIFDTLGIDRDRMEPRYYIEMLRNGETDENE